jgi:hypothetical protein
MRGPALGCWLYGSADERTYLDVDLLVSPDDEPGTAARLSELGFRDVSVEGVLPGDRPTHARTWERAGDPGPVDVHTTVLGAHAEPAAVWETLSGRTGRLTVGGLEVEILLPPALALVVALHAAHHGARVRRPLLDLERALAIAPDTVWARAALLADHLDALPAFSAGLRLVSDGKLVASRLGLPEDVPVEVALRASTAPPMALGFDWLVQQPGIRAKSALVVAKLFPPPSFMRSWTPIASRGHLGLALSYVWRLLWLGGHAASGYRAWRRVRRAG